MFRLYGSKKAKRIIQRCVPGIEALEKRFSVPSAAVAAILQQELSQIDFLDVLADQAVLCYWRLYRLLGHAPRFGKKDSSTGYAQVFGATAIDAINFALDHEIADYRALGLLTDHRLDKNDPNDLRMIWLMLHRDRGFNLLCAALTLLSAAQEMTGRIDFAHYDSEEWQLIFARYNANTKRITDYGRAAYRRYTQAL